MRLVIIIILALIVNKCISQDSLQKYSYQLLGLVIKDKDIVQPYGGSGFFIRASKRLFFITAKHVVSGCLDSNTKIDSFPTVMQITIKTNSHFEGVINLPIKEITKSIKCDSINKAPDFQIFEVKENKNVQSIESLIIPPFENVSQLIICGYPSNLVKSYNLHPNTSIIKIDIDNNDISIPIYDGIAQDYNFSIKTKYEDWLWGYSGSPVFIKDKNTNSYRIMGLLAAAAGEYLIVCNIGVVLKEIKELIDEK